MPRRILTGAVYLSLWMLLAWFGGWMLTIAIALLSLVALVELRWVVSRRRVRLAVEIGYPACVAFVYAAHRFASDPEGYGTAIFALLVLLVIVDFALHLGTGERNAGAGVSLTVFGCLYCGLLFSAVVLLRGYHPELTAPTKFGPNWELGKRLLFHLLLVTMMSDVGAYVVGKTMGRHKLVETVSPNKSIEGCLGGLVFAILASLLAGSLFNVGVTPSTAITVEQAAHASLWHRVMIGILLGVCGQVGDFGASIFKRESELKDYGRLFPGHGGVLDRFDTLIINAPLLYLYVQLAL